ncbi:cell surface protein SprA [Tenacibaculum sp. MAR_2009_124]|uniref:T9SS outer membrane translocon Sov/SprA n=1 Tax=Tenacibaculum sp. MAR_2009_124 TaxID=1250059 RepID=UPI00089533EC|nr:cell surface protein SprA [Tenacibaculum sp. MAR_2009_124]SEC54574.1 cell surface protein SprA [Tenacibaculum sp. MAR_2009_124]
MNKLFTALTLLVSVVSFSQSVANTVLKDTVIPLKYNFKHNQTGKLFLNNPSEFQVTFDKALNKFVLVEKIGDYLIGTPIFLTPKEYEKYRLKKDIKTYFKEKVDATDTRKKGKKGARKNLLPKYYVNSKFFESVFGGNTVEVIPRGQVNIKLGGVYQNNENPQISIDQQSSFTFDFDQQISASLQAKVGKRLKVTANYDTQSTFNFQNLIKLEYTPTEDDIIQGIDAGNISMPIKNSLINGAQALFGVKTELQFGKTTVTAAFSQQNSQSRTVVAEGGATIEDFELRASDYDNDRHFFLSQYFRENYKKALTQYPLVNSPVNITRIEVWVTNRTQSVNDFRSIVAIADLGESNTTPASNNLVNNTVVDPTIVPVQANGSNIPYNGVNKLDRLLTENGLIRDVTTMQSAFANEGITGVAQGTDFSYLQNARKLQPSEYRLHPQLGFISLNRRLNDGEVLSVAYEYTVVGASTSEAVFKVGEFSNDGVIAPSNLVVKLLRSEILTTVRPGVTPAEPFPTWRLMMKNVYALGAYPLRQEGFRFDLLYRDDQTGTLQNTLQNASTANIGSLPLMQIFHIDRLDQSQYQVAGGDGYFDFVEGATVNSEKGYIIFPDPEPFGNDSYLDNRLVGADDKTKYLFDELYLTTKIQAKNEYQNKDKFFLKGYYKSETSRGISLGAFNIPRGSVKVTAGGRVLVEGVDYVVDYQLGRVQILDPGLEASGVPINATVENNTFFNQQRKTFIGVDVEHRFSEDFVLGGTFLNVSERPITPKVNFGGEPIDNIMLGMNLDYSSEVPFLTKLANKLPFVETDVASKVSVRADMAYLLPGSPSGIDVNGTATSYLDDFEASQIPINLNSPQQWFLASTPESQGFEADGGANNNLSYNDHRAKIAWYNVDQLFYGTVNRPSNIDEIELSRDEVRQVRFEELFDLDLDITQQNLVRTLDLAYYPSERGPYNFNGNNDEVNIDSESNEIRLTKPDENWGGIMRSLTTNNFEQANVEYIQFWLMDPYDNYSLTGEEGVPAGVNPDLLVNQVGKLLINLGSISEDILRDGSKQYENGLPEDGVKTVGSNVRESVWGFTPINPSILYAFAADANARVNQDVGLDGLNDSEEKARFNVSVSGRNYNQLPDPAGDNFQFFRGNDLDAANASILSRYKRYNNPQGNSPTPEQSAETYPTSSSTYPDTEDINRDQTMDAVSSYFEYEVSLDKTDLNRGVGFNHIVDIKDTNVTRPDGEAKTTRWYQFRIPVRSGIPINGISDFNSIRFVRMFLTQFKMPVVLRFGELELVRSDWRRYVQTVPDDQVNNFEIGVVNIEQNGDRYELPPGIQRELLQGTNRIQRQNEQSVTLKVTDLPADSIRTIYKNISIDMRRYKNMRMFLHAEDPARNASQGQDAGAVAIIRLGTDLNENYYEIEKPLVYSAVGGSPVADQIWPVENNLDVILEDLSGLKLQRPSGAIVSELFSGLSSNGLKISVKGNPTLAQVRTVMLGVKNTSPNSKSIEVWYNELRAVGFDNKGGWAAVVNADANLADVMNLSLGGRMSTVGFGSVEDRVQQRSIEEVKQYNVATNVQIGKMMPKKWNMQIPMSYSYGEEFRDPKYDPQYQDITLEQARDAAETSNNEQARENIANAQDYTRRKSISFINVKKNRNPDSKKKQKFYDVENFSVSYSFNEEYHKDYNIEKYINQNVMAGASYNFNFKPFVIEPFKKTKILSSKYLKFIRDLNLNPVPKTIAVNSRINRNFSSQKSRNLIEGLSAQPELKQRNFVFDWDYTIGFDLTKSLQLNFNATNSFIYDSFGREEDLEIYDKFFNIGRPNSYHQKLNGTYKVPINKIPYLGFLSADYGYTADFDWQASSQSPIFNEVGELVGNVRDKVGNMIQNANTHNLNATIDFGRFYKTLKLDKLLVKKGKKGPVKKGSLKLGADQKTDGKLKLKKNASFGHKALKGLYDVLTSVKRAKISYSQNNGTLLQGYIPSVGFLGRNNFGGGLAPTFGFVFGSQTDILRNAIDNGWLVTRDPNNADDTYYNKNYGKNSNKKLDYTISVKPFKSLTIDLRGNRIQTSRLTQQLDVIKTGVNASGEDIFEQNNTIKAFETGDFSISHFMLSTMFTDGESLYQNFRDYRSTIANRLYNETGFTRPTNPDDPAFKENGQQAMLPAFLAAYSGQDPNSVSTSPFKNIPIPNWTLRYNGLMKYKWFKKNFSSFTLTHGYKSSYTIGNYTNNLQYEEGVANTSGNFQPNLLISSVTLIDEFSPLIKVDFRMKNSLSFKGEIRRDRSLTLNFNNNTITDINGTEYVFGFGYKIRDVKFVTRFTGKKETLKGDINLRADISMRDNLTLIRSVDESNNQVTGGERLFGIKFLADYNLSKNLTASFYYNHQTFNYAISTTFPRQAINAGLNLVYNLGN